MDAWHFELGQSVQITISGERGRIAGRAECADGGLNQYYVEYKAADGCAREGWFTADRLSPSV